MYENLEVDILFDKILSEGLDNIQAKLQQPLKFVPEIKRDEFSDPVFKEKFHTLNLMRKDHNGLRKRKISIRKTMQKIDARFKK